MTCEHCGSDHLVLVWKNWPTPSRLINRLRCVCCGREQSLAMTPEDLSDEEIESRDASLALRK